MHQTKNTTAAAMTQAEFEAARQIYFGRRASSH